MEPRLDPLFAAHAPVLAAFPCRRFNQPWTRDIEEMVQRHLADALDAEEVEALGLWLGAELVGVVAWRRVRERPEVVRCSVLAVRTGFVRRGYGRRLKVALLELARQEGARAVESIVHYDNDAMIDLDVELGANVERIPGDPDYVVCVIPL